MFLGAVFFVLFSLYFIFSTFISGELTPVVESAVAFSGQINQINKEQVDLGLPVRLKIPAIKVDAAIEYVGLTLDGAMDTPKNQEDVAWFNLSPRPGEIGSAIITGHYGWKNRKASAFDNLYKLRKGDKLYVEDDMGAIITFVVRENRRYDPDADATYILNSGDKKAHLNFITCEGDWDKTTKSYSKRLVVFTDKE
ncbi:MAG: class F sortase [Patescibacteria group bacterium]